MSSIPENASSNQPAPLITPRLLGEVEEMAERTLTAWLDEVQAPAEIRLLIRDQAYLIQLEAQGPDGFMPEYPERYAFEVMGVLSALIDTCSAIHIKKFPLPSRAE